jgi:D-amino-acid oxidase
MQARLPSNIFLYYRAGVAGLTTTLLLSQNPRYKIVVAAKHMPGDYDIEYASPWAGANYMP